MQSSEKLAKELVTAGGEINVNIGMFAGHNFIEMLKII